MCFIHYGCSRGSQDCFVFVFSSSVRDWVAIYCDQESVCEKGYTFSFPFLFILREYILKRKTEAKTNYHKGYIVIKKQLKFSVRMYWPLPFPELILSSFKQIAFGFIPSVFSFSFSLNSFFKLQAPTPQQP